MYFVIQEMLDIIWLFYFSIINLPKKKAVTSAASVYRIYLLQGQKIKWRVLEFW